MGTRVLLRSSMRAFVALLGLFVLALPFAAAQKDAPDETSRDAWVEDCPPDMMCAYDADEPQPLGPEDCIECTGPVEDGGETCMDGADPGEDCPDDVQYLDGRGPADCESCRGEDGAGVQGGDAKDVPLPQALVVVGALAAAVLLVRRAA